MACDYRMNMAQRLRYFAAALALALCALTCLTAAGSADLSSGAHLSSTPPIGGVDIIAVGAEPAREADRAIAQAQKLHARVVRTEVPWSDLEPTGPSQVEPRALAFADRLVSDAA